MPIKNLKLTLLGLLLSFCTSLHAAIILDTGPAWPGDADTSDYVFNFTSPTSNSVVYPNISDSSVANLYFGLSATGSDIWGYSMDSDGVVTSAESLSWFSDTSSTIEYRGITDIQLQGALTSFNYKYLLTAVSGATVVSDATTLGLSNDVHSLFQVDLSAGSVFEIKREIFVQTLNNGWVDATAFFDNAFTYTGLHKDRCDGCSRTNIGTGFYAQSTVDVPEPAGFSMFAVGLIGFLIRKYKY